MAYPFERLSYIFRPYFLGNWLDSSKPDYSSRMNLNVKVLDLVQWVDLTVVEPGG